MGPRTWAGGVCDAPSHRRLNVGSRAGWVLALLLAPGRSWAEGPGPTRVTFASRRVPEAVRPIAAPPAPTIAGTADAGAEARAKRIVVGDADGRVMVARVIGERGREVVALLPDGRLGWPDGLVPTDEPFRPDTAGELRDRLLAGEYRGFAVRQTAHYLVFSRGSAEFAAASAQLLESLYRGLTAALGRAGVPVREAEFPLVAVIHPTEREFRARHDVPPDVQAYYHVLSNRIYFYEASGRDRDAPEIAEMRRPQTVAHEGTHQVLQNIGVQPRLAAWPAWLAEGLAEYCAPTTTDPRGKWASLGKVNPFHMATFRALADPLSAAATPASTRPADLRRSGVEILVTRPELSPTDYARSWALTHYLATRRREPFVSYLRAMGQLSPLERRTPEQHLADFRAAFGRDLDRRVAHHLEILPEPEVLPFYAVAFEQSMPEGPPLRATLVSQSPSAVRRWLDAQYSPHGGTPTWEIEPCATRASALRYVRGWLEGP